MNFSRSTKIFLLSALCYLATLITSCTHTTKNGDFTSYSSAKMRKGVWAIQSFTAPLACNKIYEFEALNLPSPVNPTNFSVQVIEHCKDGREVDLYNTSLDMEVEVRSHPDRFLISSFKTNVRLRRERKEQNKLRYKSFILIVRFTGKSSGESHKSFQIMYDGGL